MILYNYYNQKMEIHWHIVYCVVFIIVVVYLIDVYQLELVSFMVLLCIIVDTIYIYLKSILTSIITISIQLSDIFINCIVIMIEFNDGYCWSYYKVIYFSCLLFIHSLMIYLSITSSELIFYSTNRWVKQYFINLNDKCDVIQSQNGKNINLMDICIVHQLTVL